MRSKNTREITFAGMSAALVFLTTWALHVPSGINGGYIHFGDALVYLAAAMLPPHLAMPAAAIGAGLSDLMTPGAAVWVVPTVIIKSLCCLPFTSKDDKLLNKRNILALFVSGAITIVGYGIATAIISGSVAAAVAEAPLALVQPTGSAICFIAIAAALDRTGIKKSVRLEVKKS